MATVANIFFVRYLFKWACERFECAPADTQFDIGDILFIYSGTKRNNKPMIYHLFQRYLTIFSLSLHVCICINIDTMYAKVRECVFYFCLFNSACLNVHPEHKFLYDRLIYLNSKSFTSRKLFNIIYIMLVYIVCNSLLFHNYHYFS